MNRKSQLLVFVLLLILPPFIILFSRLFFPANYLFSSMYKIIFLFPLFFRFLIEKKSFKQSLFENFHFSTFKKNFFKVVLIGVSLAFVYFTAFFFFKGFLDLNSISVKLSSLISLNVSNLLFIGLYIIVINSLLEEFFWRGFLFKELRQLTRPWFAYLSTAVAFSFHHVVFYYDWFSLPFFVVVTLGLVGYAFIMNLVFQKYKDLFSCWLIHAFVDVVQIFIAFQIFL